MNDFGHRSGIRVLIVEDDEDDILLIKDLISEGPKELCFTLEHSHSFYEAYELISCNSYDMCMLDYDLGELTGLDLLQKIRSEGIYTPVVFLTGQGDEEIAVAAMKAGAIDYIPKSKLSTELLINAITYALRLSKEIELRKQAEAALKESEARLRELSIKDELTGLYNRRGFFTLAEQQLKVSNRTGTQMALFFMDIDGLKTINDTLGHRAGDAALSMASGILKETFREADIVARIGGDEFTALVTDISGSSEEAIMERFDENLQNLNRTGNLPYVLSFSIGIVRYDPEAPCCSLDELIAHADAFMYSDKEKKRSS